MTSVAAASTPSQLAARAAAGFAVLALLSLAALHIVQPDIPLGTSMISQYALGHHGWLMNLCFAAFSAASLALLVALIGVKTILARVGLVLLLLTALGLSFGAMFNMDATTDPAQMTFSGRMHGVAFMLGVPSELLSTLIVSLALRREHLWKGSPLLILTALVWISSIVMGVSLMTWMQAGATGPAIFGVPNRTFMISYALWIIVAAWPLMRRGA
jgi:hypothetical protein